jgi:peptidyl-prolyl cis-trans isomerase NIMA-interacting 1
VQSGDIVDCIKLKSRAFWVIGTPKRGTGNKAPEIRLAHLSYPLLPGRPEKAQITTLHESISRQHAALVHHRDGRWFLIDLKSAHGTSVRGRKITPYVPEQLVENDEISFGKADRVYTLRSGEIPEEFQDEALRAAKKKRADDAEAEQPAPKRQKVQQVQASHILVKHNGSRNPSSWREAKITRSKDEAAAIVAGYRNEIMSGMKTFEDIARNFSDCSSAKRGGDLGPFGPGQMQKEFEDASYEINIKFAFFTPRFILSSFARRSFALRVGEISDLVFSASGVHIIKRTA